MSGSIRQRLTRREFLAGTVAAATLAACSDDGGSGGEEGHRSSTTTTVPVSNPFTLGVASGDPLPDSVVLWTMLRPDEPLLPLDIDVEWEVGRDREFSDVVATGTAQAIATLGHSVHVDVTDLDPDTEYWYRFRLGEYETGAARTRTFAALGTTPDRFTFAFSSCQDWEGGYYAAYRDVVEADSLDAFVFLGDYIYESASSVSADGLGRPTGQDFECKTVDQYRKRYALYRSDSLLQAAHARVPWIVTWDDHEVANNYAGAVSEHDSPVEEFLDRRAAAYQVWYEFMPLRLDPPTGPDLEIYRSVAHGDLVRFHVLDTRQYRSDQQRGEPFFEMLGPGVQVRQEEETGRTMLGSAQRQWLLEGAGASTAIWDVVAQQVFMFGGNGIPDADPPVVLVDTWDGYSEERRAVLEGVAGNVANLVVLSGDFHAASVGDLRVDPFDHNLPIVGTEFLSASISSSFYGDNEEVIGILVAAVQTNPQIKWLNTKRGYALCDVTPERWVTTYRVVEDESDESSAVYTASTWEVRAGSPGAIRID